MVAVPRRQQRQALRRRHRGLEPGQRIYQRRRPGGRDQAGAGHGPWKLWRVCTVGCQLGDAERRNAGGDQECAFVRAAGEWDGGGHWGFIQLEGRAHAPPSTLPSFLFTLGEG